MKIDTSAWTSCIPPADVVQVTDVLLGFSIQMGVLGFVLGVIFVYAFVPFLVSAYWKLMHKYLKTDLPLHNEN